MVLNPGKLRDDMVISAVLKEGQGAATFGAFHL